MFLHHQSAELQSAAVKRQEMTCPSLRGCASIPYYFPAPSGPGAPRPRLCLYFVGHRDSASLVAPKLALSLICHPPKLHHCASSSFHVHDSFFGERGTMCDICLLDYNVGDVVAWSRNPKCTHAYHIECIVDWLLRRPSCPSCRQDYVIPEEVLQHEKPATPVLVVQSGPQMQVQTIEQWTAQQQQQQQQQSSEAGVVSAASNATTTAANNSGGNTGGTAGSNANLAVSTGSADEGPANHTSQDDSLEAEA